MKAIENDKIFLEKVIFFNDVYPSGIKILLSLNIMEGSVKWKVKK